MTWAFDVTSNIPRLYQSGTETNLDGIATVITAVPVVARSTPVNTSMMRKPPTPTGFWYRCSTAGTTAATAPTYGTTDGGTTTDGTSVWTAFLAPINLLGGTKPIYYMPAIRMEITGTLTNANNQISTFTCLDLILSSASSNFTSGAWASDGITPLYSGTHFTTTLLTGNNTAPSIQVNAGTMTLIGGEVQTAAAVQIYPSGPKILSYYTRWRSSRVIGGVSSNRFRAYSATSVFRGCEFYDMAYDLFVMPAEFSVVARDSEYVAQYVGGAYGGVDAYFKASALQNPNGSYDFDNYSGGYVELFNCVKGANLNVTSQLPSNRHCVPLYQDVRITAKDTAGVAVQNVRFTATDVPDNSPTITITTAGNLKTWDFRSPLTYQTTSNASGIALSSPILKVWYYQGSLKQNLRFPASTVTFQGRAYGFKTLNVPVVLGSDTIQDVSAGMVAQDTATILSESAALALGKFIFTPSGATGGNVTATASYTANELWDSYEAWIAQFANRASNDTWTAIAGKLNMGAWTLANNTGVTGSAGPTLSYIYAASITLTGTASMALLYGTSVGDSCTLRLQSVSATAVAAIWHPSTSATELFQTNNSGSTAAYEIYYPPGSVGLVKNYARELYSSQRVSGSITLAAGLNTVSFVDIPDVGITQPVLANVLAYTSLEIPSKFYDRTAAFRLTEQGIKLGQIATRSGTAIEIGTFSHLINQSAAAVYSVLGSVITTKSANYEPDSKYTKEIALPPATITAASTEIITISIEDANGDSQAVVAGTSNNLVDVWKITNATPVAEFATGVKIGSDIGNGAFRWIGLDGFKLVFNNKDNGVYRYCSMSKGDYTVGWYLYDVPTGGLTQEQGDVLNNISLKATDTFNDVNSMTQGFVESTDNLHALRLAVDTKPTLAQIEASTVLAMKADVLTRLAASAYTAPDNASILAAKDNSDLIPILLAK